MTKLISDSKLRVLKSAIEKFTDHNEHTYSVLVLADFMGSGQAHIRLNEILKEHDRLGHMPYELIQERTKIREKLIEQVSEDYGPKAGHIINSAF